MDLKFKNVYLIGIILTISMTGCFSPSNDEIKGIAYTYGNGTFKKSEIEILDTYKKEGRTIYMLDINGALCEIPIVKMKDKVVGTGFQCKGNPISKEFLRAETVNENDRPAVKRKKSISNVKRKKSISDVDILYPMDTFIVNIKSDAGRRYLKVTMSLELENKELSTELDAKLPVLRDRIIRFLSSKTLNEISSRKGKRNIEIQIMDTLNSMVVNGKIQDVYFTEFVIQ